MTLVNSQTERQFGYRREEMLDQSVELLVPERFRGPHPELRAEFFRAPEARPMGLGRELFGLRKDRTATPVEIGLNPIRTLEGNFVLASIIDITERKRAEQGMKDSLREKETLLKEVHHRVKNNLQIICSVLQLQTGYLKDPHTLHVFRESQNRVRSMALIHEKLYQTGNFAQLDFAEYVRGLVNMLLGTYRTPTCAVRLTPEIEAVSLNLDTAIPLGLILNEAISNSLEHAFPNRKEGNIWVRLRHLADGALELTVQYDGVGLAQEFDREHCSSLGLHLILSLAEQLHGTVEIRRQPGTTVTLTAMPDRKWEGNKDHVS